MTQQYLFSQREKEVIEFLLQGKSNKQIALALGVSRSTVEYHLKNVYKILHVSSRTEAVLQLGKSTVEMDGEPADNGDKPISIRRIPMNKKMLFGSIGTLIVVALIAGIIVVYRIANTTRGQKIIQNIQNPPIVQAVQETPANPNIQYFSDWLVWSPDNQYLAVRTSTTLEVYDAKTYQFDSAYASGGAIAFGRQHMAEVGEAVYVWGNEFLRTDKSDYSSIAFSPDDDKLFATGENGRFRIWNLRQGKVIAEIPVDGYVSDLAFSSSNTLVVILQTSDMIQTWDVDSGKLITSFQIPRDVVDFTLSRDGKVVLVDYGVAGFELWDISAGEKLRQFPDAVGAIGFNSLSDDHQRVVVWGYNVDLHNSGLSVWDLSTGKRIKEFITPIVNGDGWRAGALNSDGSVLAASNNEGYVYFYDVNSGKELGKIHLEKSEESSTPTPQQLKTCTRVNEVQICGKDVIFTNEKTFVKLEITVPSTLLKSLGINPNGFIVPTLGEKPLYPTLTGDEGTVIGTATSPGSFTSIAEKGIYIQMLEFPLPPPPGAYYVTLAFSQVNIGENSIQGDFKVEISIR